MSLTRHLEDPTSTVRRIIEAYAPDVAMAGTRGTSGRQMAEHLGFDKLLTLETQVPVPKGAKPDHSGLVGTALDYRLRMDLPSFDFTDSKAQTGLDILKRRPNITPNGQHVHAVLEDAMAFAYLTFQELKPEPLSVGRACVVLAWCENIYRAGPRALSGAFGDLVRQTKNAQDLMLGIHEALLKDIALMHHAVSPQLDEWNQQIDEGLRRQPQLRR